MNGGRRFCWAVAGLTAWLGLAGSGLAAGLRDIRDSWLVDPETAWVLLGGCQEGPSALVRPRPSLVLDCGQGRLYSLPELPQLEAGLRLRAGLGSQLVTLSASWRTLGGEIYRENTLQLAIGLGTRPGIGVGLERTTQNLAGELEPAVSRIFLAAERPFELGQDRILLLRAQLFVNPDPDPEFQPDRLPFLSAAFLGRQAGLAVAVDRRWDGAPVAGLEAFWIAGSGVGVSLRVDAATGALGPGLHVRRGALLLRTSHLTHPVLGQTHRFQLGVVRSHG